jgi:hypothetical protein
MPSFNWKNFFRSLAAHWIPFLCRWISLQPNPLPSQDAQSHRIRPKNVILPSDSVAPRYDIVLSYVIKESARFTRLLQEELIKHGHSVFVGEVDIGGGDNWPLELSRVIRDCKAFIPIITPSYGNTKWTLKEIQFAENRNRPMIPILLQQEKKYPQSVELHLSAIQWIDFSSFLVRGTLDPKCLEHLVKKLETLK